MSSSTAILDAKRCTERRLLTLTPSVATGFEAVEFTAPNAVMYQRCQYVVFDPEDPTFPAGYHRERMQMQVFVADIKGKGTTAAITRAGLIRDLFYKGLTLTESNTKIHILNTPQIASAVITNDRVVVPVLIMLTVEVYS